jgi:2'-5' RNA ligase
MTAPTRRLFIALWPEADALAGVLQWQAGWKWPSRATRTKPERVHVTLHFLGDVTLDPGALAQGLRVPFTPFTIDFGKAVQWPHGLAVLEPLSVPPALLRLQADLGHALAVMGLPVEERRYRPHVTLARRAMHAVPPAAGPVFGWRAGSYVLVESVPGQGYQILHRFG